MVKKLIKKKPARPAIPVKIQLKLWVKSGGRCQFRGCNKELWQENLTLSDGNYSEIAHIISYSAKGPRGDKVLSPKLVKSYENLMLLCFDCHNRIDDPIEKKNYSVSLLQKYKLEHENRISLLTNITDECKTKIVTLKERVSGGSAKFAYKSLTKDALPLYPESKTPYSIDFSSLSIEGGQYFKSIKSDLRGAVSDIFRESQGHISIFALGRISTLIQLGAFIGDRTQVDIFNYQRSKGRWMWGKDESVEIKIKSTINKKNEKRVAILISMSGVISESKVVNNVYKFQNIISLSIRNPTIDAISSKNSFENFSVKMREALSLARNELGPGYTLDIFAAVSCPVAIQIGRSVNKKLERIVNVYELNSNSIYENIGRLG